MLADYSQSPLDPPSAPFRNASAAASLRSMSPGGSDASGPVSLSINYLPSKFSQQGFHKRKTGKGEALLPKRGGGREAFRSGEARMGGEGDEDDQGFFGGKEGGKTKARLRWTKFKWILFVANTLVSLISLKCICIALLRVFSGVFSHRRGVKSHQCCAGRRRLRLVGGLKHGPTLFGSSFCGAGLGSGWWKISRFVPSNGRIVRLGPRLVVVPCTWRPPWSEARLRLPPVVSDRHNTESHPLA